MTICRRMIATTQRDGIGGKHTIYSDGDIFSASIVFNQSLEEKIAMSQGAKVNYNVLTSRDILLNYHDVFRRMSDGKVFRVTSDSEDNVTPKSATLNLRSVTAEEWEVGNE